MNYISFLSLSLSIMLVLTSTTQAAGNPERGKALSSSCTACHGENGISTTPTFPHLAGQYADYLAQAMSDYQSGTRQNAIMQPLLSNLSEQDIKDLAAYYASQKKLKILNQTID